MYAAPLLLARAAAAADIDTMDAHRIILLVIITSACLFVVFGLMVWWSRYLARVNSARVHLVLPERQLFSQSPPSPSASIMLN